MSADRIRSRSSLSRILGRLSKVQKTEITVPAEAGLGKRRTKPQPARFGLFMSANLKRYVKTSYNK
ncbi:hypothetical protein D7M11_08775 [Paenibacillus ginsengarvi]|uniref:Uncharacterized protein n=1 Tax=Paenibacillus ginsengarvi TaxID=400777 RepID=A0A3B0CK19_9BACL|nr:hypothetical protein D7M11_08775 [Paenibacillus ginsengarvi]